MPSNWPDVTKLTAAWPASAVSVPGAVPIRKAKKQVNQALKDDAEGKTDDIIQQSMNKWLERQSKL